MALNHRKDTLEVAHITGVQGIRAAMEVLAREKGSAGYEGADSGTDGEGLGSGAGNEGAGCEGAASSCEGAGLRAGVPSAAADGSLPGTVTEEVPLGCRTCAVCAADNDGARETCWNCGASLRRVR